MRRLAERYLELYTRALVPTGLMTQSRRPPP